MPRTDRDVRQNPMPGDTMAFICPEYGYQRRVFWVSDETETSPSLCFRVTSITGETWVDGCVLATWQHWASLPDVVVEHIAEEKGEQNGKT